MSHKSGGVIINSMLTQGPNDGPLACLSQDQCSNLSEIRTRDEYTITDRVFLAALVASISDDPAD